MTFAKPLFLACLIPACTGLHTGSADTNDGSDIGGTDVGDTGAGGGPGDTGGDTGETLKVGSHYNLNSLFSITVASVSPEPAYELLADLNNDPGSALVTIADAAGVPAAQLLFDALPDSLSGRVEQWMTDAIGSNVELQVLMEWSQLVLANAEVQSSLDIGTFETTATGEGEQATALHTLESFVFHVDGKLVEEDVPQIEQLPGAGHAEVSVTAVHDEQGLHLRMGEQRFGVLFGTAAYRAFESLVQARYGTDLRGVLGDAVDCSAMAAEVADRCVLGVCVAHESELQGLCEGALDSAVGQIRDQFSALDTELLSLDSGEALVEASGTGTVLTGGQWSAQAELGQGLRSLPASFSGSSL